MPSPGRWLAATAALVCAGVCALTPAAALNSEGVVPGASDISEVRLIRADSMALTQSAGQPQVLNGDVEVVVVDTNQRESRINAMKISIFTAGKERQVDRLVAEGRVVMVREGLTAKTELAIYDGKQNTLDLLQDNYVHDARGELTADRIRVNLATNQVSAEGNVRGIVYPQAFEATDDGR